MARIDFAVSTSASKAKMAEWWTSVFFSKKCGKSDVMKTVNIDLVMVVYNSKAVY